MACSYFTIDKSQIELGFVAPNQTVTSTINVTDISGDKRDIYVFISCDGGVTKDPISDNPDFAGCLDSFFLADNSTYAYSLVFNPSAVLGRNCIIYFMAAAECFNTVTFTTFAVQDICVKKTGCNKFYVALFEEKAGVEINSVSIFNPITGTTTGVSNPKSILLPGDGVYFLIIVVNGKRIYYPVFDFCNIFACVKKLITDILCKDDICCQNCDEKALRQKRDELNKIIAVFMVFLGYLNQFRLNYMNVLCNTDAETYDLLEINKLYENLKKLTENCGECKANTIQSTIVKSQCKTC